MPLCLIESLCMTIRKCFYEALRTINDLLISDLERYVVYYLRLIKGIV